MSDAPQEGTCFAAFMNGMRVIGFYTTEKAAKKRVVTAMNVRNARWDAQIPSDSMRRVGVKRTFLLRSPSGLQGVVYEVVPTD